MRATVTTLAALVGVAAAVASTPALAAAGRLPLEAVPERYAITLSPHLDAGTFDGQERIALRVPKPTTTVTLNAADMTITRAAVGGNVATVKQDAEAETATLTFATPIAAGTAQLDVTWQAKLSSKLRGFYHAESEGKRYAFTDFEPTDARRAFPCFDEPALKARFTMTAVVDPAHLAVSNTPVASEKIEGGKKTVRFAETPRLSTYLVALAVGPLVAGATVPGKTPIRVITTPEQGRARQATRPASPRAVAVLREVLRRALRLRQARPRRRARLRGGRDGERGRHLLPRERAARRRALVARAPAAGGDGDRARDGAPVVRRPRDHAVVGRPVAQRGVRVVGGEPRRGGAAPGLAAVAGGGARARGRARRPTRSPPRIRSACRDQPRSGARGLRQHHL